MVKRIISAALCAAALIGLCSCSEGAPLPDETSEVEQTLDIVGNNFSPVPTVKLETPVITYLGTGSVPQSSAELYRRTYAAQYFDASSGQYVFPDGSGTLIVSRTVTEGQLPDELIASIQSDASPDLTDKLDNSYPYLMSRNIYEDLTAYMDMSSPQWVDMGEYVDRYEFNGKHFYYPWDYTMSPQLLFYNRGLFEQYGIPDPAELIGEDNWTWETFLEDCRLFALADNNAVGLYGKDIAENFIASTGVMLIGRDENGKLMSNFSSEEVSRAAEWLGELAPSVSGDCPESAAEDGLAAFYSADREYADETELFFVPYPRDERAEKYFCRASTRGYLVPKGAKNVVGACCFINCCRLDIYGDVPEETTFSDETGFVMGTSESGEPQTGESETDINPADILIKLRNHDLFSGVADENRCFSEEINAVIDRMLDNILISDDIGWEQRCAENLPVINAAVDELNSLI